MSYPFDYNLLLDFFYSDSFARFVFGFKIFSGTISVVLFVGIIALGIKTKKFWERFGKITQSLDAVSEIKGKEKIVKKWEEITAKSISHVDSDRKLSVIEADKLIDDLLKRMGFKGKDMGERLKQINQNQISNINDIWQAHKVRNNLVHDPYFHLTNNDSGFVIRVYGNTLKEVGIL